MHSSDIVNVVKATCSMYIHKPAAAAAQEDILTCDLQTVECTQASSQVKEMFRSVARSISQLLRCVQAKGDL